MPRSSINAIPRPSALERPGCWSIAGMPWLNTALNGGLRPGASYLIGGAPGSMKTTLMVDAAIGLAAHGVKVLYLMTEQGPAELDGICHRITNNRRAIRRFWK